MFSSQFKVQPITVGKPEREALTQLLTLYLQQRHTERAAGMLLSSFPSLPRHCFQPGNGATEGGQVFPP